MSGELRFLCGYRHKDFRDRSQIDKAFAIIRAALKANAETPLSPQRGRMRS
jgi:hypothetical protein